MMMIEIRQTPIILSAYVSWRSSRNSLSELIRLQRWPKSHKCSLVSPRSYEWWTGLAIIHLSNPGIQILLNEWPIRYQTTGGGLPVWLADCSSIVTLPIQPCVLSLSATLAVEENLFAFLFYGGSSALSALAIALRCLIFLKKAFDIVCRFKIFAGERAGHRVSCEFGPEDLGHWHSECYLSEFSYKFNDTSTASGCSCFDLGDNTCCNLYK